MTQAKHLTTTNTESSSFRKEHYVFFALIALFCATYFECALEIANVERTDMASGLFFGTIDIACVLRVLIAAFVVFVSTLLLSPHLKVFDWIVDHRFLLAVGLLVVLVAFEISGSSISLWGPLLHGEAYEGVLLGVPRDIRSDEWLVFTPFSLSQVATGFHAVSPAMAGGGINTTMVYAQPAWALATLFRPFLWGYLALGAAKGLAFFWCARAIALVLVTYECMELLSDGNRRIAAYGAILVGFAPIIEWWFAVNGTVELFVYGQGLVLALRHSLRAQSAIARWGWSLFLGWLLGCYALILYPAWQVPVAYAFGSLGIWVIIQWVHQKHDGPWGKVLPRHLLPLVVCTVFAIAAVGVCVYLAWDAVQATLDTVYPGKRFCVGGGLTVWQPNSIATLVSPLWPELFEPNVSEDAAFVSLQPLGVLLAIICLVKCALQRKTDSGLICLLVGSAFLYAYGIMGFSPALSKITLLSNVQTLRVVIATGYLDIALLVRSLAVLSSRFATGDDAVSWKSHVVRVGGALVVAVGATFATLRGVPEIAGVKATVILFVAMAILLIPVFARKSSAAFGTMLLASSLVVLTVGMCVNPLQRGCDVLLRNPTLAEAKSIAENDPDTLWATDSAIVGQAFVSSGIPTLTSTNIYPNLDLWHRIDPDATNCDAYNRYAHVNLVMGESTSFQNPTPDSILVTVTPDDVVKLGISYWYSNEDLTQWDTTSVRFKPLRVMQGGTVYHVEVTE